MTEWPRGLVDYVPRGGDESSPSPDQDRTGNRLRLAARLLGVLRAQGENVERELAALSEAQRAYARKETVRATELVEELLAMLDARSRSASRSGPIP